VVYAKNPETTPEEKHYPASGIALGITVVKTRLDLTDSVYIPFTLLIFALHFCGKVTITFRNEKYFFFF
jgi:hypothetical protein